MEEGFGHTEDVSVAENLITPKDISISQKIFDHTTVLNIDKVSGLTTDLYIDLYID